MHVVRPDNHLVPLGWRRLKSLSGVPPASFSTAAFQEFPGCLSMMEISPQPPIALIGICGPFCKLFGSFCLHKMMTIRKKRKRKKLTQPITQLLGFNSSDLHGLGCLLLWAEQEQNQIQDFPLLLLFIP